MKRCIAVVVCAACSNRASAPAKQSVASAPDDASVHDAGSGESPAPACAASADPDVDLLHLAGAKVAVSSTVANEKLPPSALVDGDLQTAWNSRTGELEGAWIGVRVPRTACITRIAMTAGFTGEGPEGDYFVMNPRIREVRVTRRHASPSGPEVVDEIGRFPLDPDSRELQSLPVHGPGGDYRIEVTATVPGTRKSWREACVSEIEVWGQPPPGQRASELHIVPGAIRHIVPLVVVGSLDANPPADPLALDHLPAGPFRSTDDFCARWMEPRKRYEAAWGRVCDANPHDEECDPKGCGPALHCDVTPAAPSPPPGQRTDAQASLASLGPFRAAELVTLRESGCSAPPCYLAVTDARGTWFVHEIGKCEGAEGERAGIGTIALHAVGQQLVWQYEHYTGGDDHVMNERGTVRCRAAASGSSGPSCTSDVVPGPEEHP
jgi:hypothetical protein